MFIQIWNLQQNPYRNRCRNSVLLLWILQCRRSYDGALPNSVLFYEQVG